MIILKKTAWIGSCFLAGLMLLNFPGKRRFQAWLVSRRPIYSSINALRRRAHQPPLELERTLGRSPSRHDS